MNTTLAPSAPVAAPGSLVYSPETVGEFNTALAKRLQSLKKDAGAESLRQGYKGTGRAAPRRQLWVRFDSGALIDLWADFGFLRLGGVVCNAPAGSAHPGGVYRRQIPYAGRTVEEVYQAALAVLKPWAAGVPA